LTEQIIFNTFVGILDHVTGQRQLQHRGSRRREQQSGRSQFFTVLLEKLTVPQLVKKPPAFYEARKFYSVQKQPATLPGPEPDQSSLRSPNRFENQLNKGVDRQINK